MYTNRTDTDRSQSQLKVLVPIHILIPKLFIKDMEI